MAARLLGETEESKNKTKFIRPMLHSLSYDRASSIAWNEFQMFLHVPLKRRNWDICFENYSEWYSLLPAWLFGQAGGENLGCHCLNLKEVFFVLVWFLYLQCLEIEGASILLVIVQVTENDKIYKWQEGIQIWQSMRWKCDDWPMIIQGWMGWIWHDPKAFVFTPSTPRKKLPLMAKHWVIMIKILIFQPFWGEFSRMERRRKPYLSDWKLKRLNDQENVSNKENVIFMQYEFWIYGPAITQSIIGHCILDGSYWTLGFNMFG